MSLAKRGTRGSSCSRRVGAVVLVCAVAWLTSSCGFLFHKPRVEQAPGTELGAWRLRCEWVERGPRGPQEPPGPRDWGEVWASTPVGRDIELEGRLEDGFYVLDGVRLGVAPVRDPERAWWQQIPGLRPAPPAPPPHEEPPAAAESALAVACRETLARVRPELPSELVLVAAARSGEEIDVPIVFPPTGSPTPGSGRITPIRRLVVFGDSLSDPGNLKSRLAIFPATPYWLGRFSNGPVWPEYLGAAAGLAVQNHSFGGAITVPHDEVPTSSVIASVQQGAQHFLTGSVDRYVADYLARDLTWGTVQSPNDTLFVVWSGGNDYLMKEGVSGEIGSLLDSPAGESGYFRIVEETTRATADMVRRLYAAGGRRFVVFGLPDLGRTPGVLHNETYEPAGVRNETARRTLLSRRLTALSKRHNRELAAALAQVRAEHPGTPILFLDTAVGVASILEGRVPKSLDPAAWKQLGRGRRFDYGFDLVSLRSDALRDGQGPLPVQDRCYRGGYLGTSDPQKVCAEEPRAFFWDAVHPTTLTHCWLATLVQRDLADAGMITAEPDLSTARSSCLDAAVRWTGVAALPEPERLPRDQRSSRKTAKKSSP